MNISVFANQDQWKELCNGQGESLVLAENTQDIGPNTIALVVLTEHRKLNLTGFTKPIFINAVETSLKELKMPSNVIRFNGWPGFIDKKNWEVSGILSNEAGDVLAKMGKKAKVVDDDEGFVSPRIISMIINEAFFALEEGISSRQEIDVAMKLGTNYPFGPFEWCSRIGADKIFRLLNKLSTRDKRYVPSHLLAQEAAQ